VCSKASGKGTAEVLAYVNRPVRCTAPTAIDTLASLVDIMALRHTVEGLDEIISETAFRRRGMLLFSMILPRWELGH
jgi:hypothetical protein